MSYAYGNQSTFPPVTEDMDLARVIDVIFKNLGYSIEDIQTSDTLAYMRLLDRDALCYLFYWIEMWLYLRHKKEIWFPATDIDLLMEKNSHIRMRRRVTYVLLCRYIRKKVHRIERTLITGR